MADPSCVVLVPSSRVYDSGTEAALAELSRRRFPVWRIKGEAHPDTRDRMAVDAMSAGFAELLFIDPSIVFEPDDVERLRARGVAVVCGVYPIPGRQVLSCDFDPGVRNVRFGRYGVPAVVQTADLGFALIRRTALDAILALAVGDPDSGCLFAPASGFTGSGSPDTGRWFCERARRAGVRVIADTSIRLWKVGPYRHGWEDAGGIPIRHEDYTFFPTSTTASIQVVSPETASPPEPAPRPQPTRSPLRPKLTPRASGFPRLKAFVVTYPANRDSLELTLASFRATDWGEDPVIVDQPVDWPAGGDSAPRNYKRALEAAAQGGCDYALILEDDTRFNRHLRHNVLSLPLVQRDQCDYLSLFVPDLLADPWERSESNLGYRLAKPRYGGPDRLWEKHRVWGVQAVLLSRRLVTAALDRWDRLAGVQDARLLGVCGELGVPLFYSDPCWVDHVPLRSGYNTPLAYAPDFDPEFKLEVLPAFLPPECVPGWLTRREAELLGQTAKNRSVLEIGAACGQATLCLAQFAERVLAIDSVEAEAREWIERFGCDSRVRFDRLETLEGAKQFDLLVLSARDSGGLNRDVASGVPLLAPEARIAVLNYPDPAWPDVRTTIDSTAARLGWRRIRQVDYTAIFQSQSSASQESVSDREESLSELPE